MPASHPFAAPAATDPRDPPRESVAIHSVAALVGPSLLFSPLAGLAVLSLNWWRVGERERAFVVPVLAMVALFAWVVTVGMAGVVVDTWASGDPSSVFLPAEVGLWLGTPIVLAVDHTALRARHPEAVIRRPSLEAYVFGAFAAVSVIEAVRWLLVR